MNRHFWTIATLLFTLSNLTSHGMSVSYENGKVTLECTETPAPEVLAALAKESGIPIAIDKSDTALVSGSYTNITLEKLIPKISHGSVLIYGKDKSSGAYKLERIQASREGTPQDLNSGELNQAQVIKNIIERTKGIKRFSQDISMSVNMMGMDMDIEGKMWIDGDKMRMEMLTQPMNMKQIMVSDGETMFTYMPSMNMVQKIDMAKLKEAMGAEFGDLMSQQSMGSANPFEGIDPESLTYLGLEELNGESTYILDGIINESLKSIEGLGAFMPDSLTFWISTDDGMPRKAVSYDDSGKEIFNQSYQNVITNPEPEPSLFEFNMPENDPTVMDMTDMVINMQKGKMPSIPTNRPSPSEVDSLKPTPATP